MCGDVNAETDEEDPAGKENVFILLICKAQGTKGTLQEKSYTEET